MVLHLAEQIDVLARERRGESLHAVGSRLPCRLRRGLLSDLSAYCFRMNDPRRHLVNHQAKPTRPQPFALGVRHTPYHGDESVRVLVLELIRGAEATHDTSLSMQQVLDAKALDGEEPFSNLYGAARGRLLNRIRDGAARLVRVIAIAFVNAILRDITCAEQIIVRKTQAAREQQQPGHTGFHRNAHLGPPPPWRSAT